MNNTVYKIMLQAGKITEATTKLALSMQTKMAVGQQPIQITTDTYNSKVSLVSPGDLKNINYDAPQTEIDEFNGKPKTQLQVDTTTPSGSAAVGVTVTQLTAFSKKNVNANPTGLKTTVFTDSSAVGAGRRRRLYNDDQRILNANPATVKLVLQNYVNQPEEYSKSMLALR